MNKCEFVGRVTKELELKQVKVGDKEENVLNFDIAVKKKGTDEADFIPITVWGKLAELTYKFSGKGLYIGITGELHTKNYTKDGIKRTAYFVNADDIDFLERKDKNGSQQQQ